MTGWHVDDDALRRWIDRTDSLSDGASVEQHLLSCDQCRARVNATVTARPVPGLVDLTTVWSRTRNAIELPRPSAFERLLRRAGLPAHEARLVAVASAFRGAWLTAWPRCWRSRPWPAPWGIPAARWSSCRWHPWCRA